MGIHAAISGGSGAAGLLASYGPCGDGAVAGLPTRSTAATGNGSVGIHAAITVGGGAGGLLASYGPCGGGGGGALLPLYGPCGDGAVAGLPTRSTAPEPEKSNGDRVGCVTTTVLTSRKIEYGSPKCAGTPAPNSLTTAPGVCDHVGEGARGVHGDASALLNHIGNEETGGQVGVRGDVFPCRGEWLPPPGKLLLPRGERKGGVLGEPLPPPGKLLLPRGERKGAVVGGRQYGAGSSMGLSTHAL